MFCTRCGFKLSDTACFCNQCGAKVNRIIIEEKKKEIIEPVLVDYCLFASAILSLIISCIPSSMFLIVFGIAFSLGASVFGVFLYMKRRNWVDFLSILMAICAFFVNIGWLYYVLIL